MKYISEEEQRRRACGELSESDWWAQVLPLVAVAAWVIFLVIYFAVLTLTKG